MKNTEYINISKVSNSSLVKRVGASTTLNSFVPINEIAQAKGLKSNRSIRLELNKPKSRYISREVKVNGGTSYEILFSSLEPELQRIFGRAESSVSEQARKVPVGRYSAGTPNNPREQKLRNAENKSTALIPRNYIPNNVITDKAKLTRNHRLNIVKSALQKRKEYEATKRTIKESDNDFLDLYNTGLYLPKAYDFLGSISIGTLRRWIQKYKKYENADSLLPQYKITK